MSYPSFEEYTDALRLPPAAVFPDPALAAGMVRKGAAGVPFARSGNFALTYEVSSNGSRYAVRCFHKESDALEQRYEAIARKLKAAAGPYFVDFDFQPAGIRTESGQFPILKMDWAEGVSLAEFISANRDDRQALLDLRETLRALARHLQEHEIAHGDIQPGNIIVKSPNELKLIDYDGMYVPELEPWGSTELGQRNFQHPGRSWLHYDERLDRFSFALLDVALEALAQQPALWELTGSDEAGIVLRAADFADPAASTAFGVLSELDALSVRAQQLAAVCRSPFERVPSLEDFLAGRRIPAAAPIRQAGSAGLARPAYMPAYSVVDATNFARCCAHIGDRVELVGRVRRVIREPAGDGVTTSLRMEFGDARQDMVRLLIMTDADGGGLAALAAMPAGQWLSAIGLVDPILTETNGDYSFKSVSLTITEQSQLRLITEAEALHRLATDPAATRPGDDVSITIGTDPALPGINVRPLPQATAGPPPLPPAPALATPVVEDPPLAPVAPVVPIAPVAPVASAAPAAPRQPAPLIAPAQATAVPRPAVIAPRTERVASSPAANARVARGTARPRAPLRRPTLPPALLPWIRARAMDVETKLRQLRLADRQAAAAAKLRTLRDRAPGVAAKLRARLGDAPNPTAKLRSMLDRAPSAAAKLRSILRDAASQGARLRAMISRAPAADVWLQRARRVHPAWWLVGLLTTLLIAQRWSYTRAPEVAAPMAAADVEDVRPRESGSTLQVETPQARPPPAIPSRGAAAPGTPSPGADSGPTATVAATPVGQSPPTSGRTTPATQARLLAFEDLRSARPPITTIAGPIDVVSSAGTQRSSVVTVNGKPIDASRAERNVLAHRSVFSDREVIVGFSSCAGATAACERSEPFWVLLRRSAPPVFKRSPGLRANKDAGGVDVAASGVHVDLGLWNGVRQVATLTSLDDVYVVRMKVSPAPLAAAQCRVVASALESCAASRDCRSYAAIAGTVPAARMAGVQRLFHETTGLNSAMFRTVCVRSCELGLTPTSGLVRREVCGGATPGQWAGPGPAG